MWELLLFNMIGEQFEEPNVIGLGLSLRTKERLFEVWIKDSTSLKIRQDISNKIRHFLNLDPNDVTLYYKNHKNSIKDKSTMKNAEGYKFLQSDQKKQAAKPFSHLAADHPGESRRF